MTNASPFFAGKLFSNSHAASYPPAEPPMPTIGQLASLLPSASCAGFDLADVDRLLLLLATVRDAFFFAVRFRGMAFFMLIPVSASDKLSLQSVAAVSDCRNMVRRSLSAATVMAIRERLKRRDVVYQRSPIYFVTACTSKREPVLASERIHSAFKKFGTSGPKFSTRVGAYVLMPSHVHLFVAIDDQKIGLSQWVKSLKGMLSHVLRDAGNSPPYWQKGFFDHLLRSSNSYSQKWHYVRENPVRAKLVTHWEEWPYHGEIFELRFHDACL